MAYKILSTILIKIFFISLVYSQWGIININQYSSYYFNWSVYFTSEDTGYLVNLDSTLLKTTNGGLNWFRLNGTSGYGLAHLQFTSQNTGFAAGYKAFNNGYLLKTTNAGQNWSVQTFSNDISSLKFINDNTGFLITYSDVIYKTTNSALSWLTQSVNASSLNSIDFVDNNNGFIAAEYGIFFKTTDGGTNWISNNTPWLNSIDFIDQNLGFGVNFVPANLGCNIYRTSNGGLLWQNVFSRDSLILGKAFFINSNTGWIAGYKVSANYVYNRVILKTTNSGSSWFEQFTGSLSDSSSCFSSIFMLNADSGYAVTFYCQYQNNPALNPMVFKTTNGGGDPIGIFNQTNEITGYALYQNYPNPFNPITSISFSIPVSGNVQIKVYDVLGEELLTLLNEYRIAGTYTISFVAADLPSGCYFYKIISGDFEDTKKMLLIR